MPGLSFLAEQGFMGTHPDNAASAQQIKKQKGMPCCKPKYFFIKI